MIKQAPNFILKIQNADVFADLVFVLVDKAIAVGQILARFKQTKKNVVNLSRSDKIIKDFYYLQILDIKVIEVFLMGVQIAMGEDSEKDKAIYS